MKAMLPEARVRVGHRSAMHLHGFERAFDQAQAHNGSLIFHDRGITGRPAMAEAN